LSGPSWRQRRRLGIAHIGRVGNLGVEYQSHVTHSYKGFDCTQSRRCGRRLDGHSFPSPKSSISRSASSQGLAIISCPKTPNPLSGTSMISSPPHRSRLLTAPRSRTGYQNSPLLVSTSPYIAPSLFPSWRLGLSILMDSHSEGSLVAKGRHWAWKKLTKQSRCTSFVDQLLATTADSTRCRPDRRATR
jgi:hypothetical protein